MTVAKEISRRAGEFVSLASCALNVLIGTGDREITLSAGAWQLKRLGSRYGAVLVFVIDRLPFNLRGLRPVDHCMHAWLEHASVWAKVTADRA